MNRPWAEYYPANKNTPNRYALFSPVFDRFLLVDNLDPWLLFETGKLLSSKVLTVTYILKADQITNNNCLCFGTQHKRNEMLYGASSLTSIKQSASMSFLKSNEIIEKGWSTEYEQEDRKQALKNLQEYALFVLQCTHAITIAESYRNLWPDAKYLDAFFADTSPAEFRTRYDTTTAPKGMMNKIKNILYHANTLTEATEQIHQAWAVYSLNDNANFRDLFYSAAGIVQPTLISTVKDNYTFWAC